MGVGHWRVGLKPQKGPWGPCWRSAFHLSLAGLNPEQNPCPELSTEKRGWLDRIMARIGMNPSRTKTTNYRPARVTVAVLVHVPHLTGYFEHRMEVVQASLESVRANTSVPYDLMVFDNGSCREVGTWLDELSLSGEIDYLVRSRRNLGKIGAFQVLFPAAVGELVAYADDDFLYYPGWLKAHLEILDTFPGVGMVSGHVVPSFFEADRIQSNTRYVSEYPGQLALDVAKIPEAWITEWAASTGREIEAALEERGDVEPFVVEFKGVRAFGAAHHDQFVAPKQVILECLPVEWSGQLMGQMLELDRAVDRAGYLRLSTADRTTQHIGNVIGPTVAAQLSQDSGQRTLSSVSADPRHRPGRFRSRFLRWRPVRWLLLGVYSHLFRWINPD